MWKFNMVNVKQQWQRDINEGSSNGSYREGRRSIRS
jgi:hypothetical protein